MAGRGPAPKAAGDRRTNRVPARGEWQPTPGHGWQHGPVPDAPDGLLAASRKAWVTWMDSWVAAHWSVIDMPGLRQLIRLYDQVERGEFQRSTELRLGMDTYGITPKGQQDRRWSPPEAGDEKPAQAETSTYGHLRVAK